MRTNNIHSIFPALLCAVLLLASCGRELGGEFAGGPSELTLRIEGRAPQTRTTYDSDGPKGEFDWSAGDKIAVHLSSGRYVEAEVDPTTSKVSVTAPAGSERDCYAVYPASSAVAANYGNPTLQLSLPASYDIAGIVTGNDARGKDFSPCPMVAVNTPAPDPGPQILNFYHVGGLLRFTLLEIPPSTARVRVRFDTDVTGTYTVADPSSTGPTITTGSGGGGNTVLFTLAGDSGVGPTVTPVINVPVPCGSYASVRVEVLGGDGAVLGFVNIRYTLNLKRHYGKRFWLLFSKSTLGTDGEGMWWTDRLNDGEEMFWDDVTDPNRGEGMKWE